ncbi:MAG: hypothetical protein HYZ29_06965 [Myxococcales bacterium]|nr:hypothetical protein [Myxococcales bacterium]
MGERVSRWTMLGGSVALSVVVACGPDPSDGDVASNAGASGAPGSGGSHATGSGGAGASSGGLSLGGASSGGSAGAGAELCDDGLDNDGNGLVDEDCTCSPGATQQCYDGPAAEAGKGACAFGVQECVAPGNGEIVQPRWGACTGSGAPTPETCNGKDDDCDGVVDDGCDCVTGAQKACSTKCGSGAQKCVAGKWGECDAQQPSATGSCTQKVNIDVDGDCVCAPPCPASAPYLVGCKIDFQGGNPNGCVAPAKGGQLYFQEGVKCDAGHLKGYIMCSDVPGPPLGPGNCPINKSDPHWGSKPSQCPDITSGKPASCYF